MASGFLCICPVKSVELGDDGAFHKAEHTAELHAMLEFEHECVASDRYAYRPGGGVRVLNPSTSMTLGETDTCIAVFKG
jgi:hypothetical protein